MDRWCKRCARWTENPEVLVQLKAAPQIMTIWSSGRRQQTANLIGRNSTREFESLYGHKLYAEIAQLVEWMLHTH